MSWFTNANHMVLQDTNLTNAQTINNNNYHAYHGITGTEHLANLQGFGRHIAYDALYDADTRFDPPKCHPQTRTAVLNSIHHHVCDPKAIQSIVWIRGPAGAGKSAIAQTLAERWKEGDLLAVSFFLSRTASGRNEKKCLVPTLAYQLGISVPSVKQHITDAIHSDPGLLKRNLKAQIMELIVRPLAKVSSDTRLLLPRVVVIDGLDECCIDYEFQGHEEQQREILEALVFATQQKGFPLCFLVASRPERQIRECFGSEPLKSLTFLVHLDARQNPDADIRVFLNWEFDEIRRKHSYLGPSWPPAGTVDKLVAKSSGQFIYASVVARYITSPRSDPEASLRTIMGVGASVDEGNSPFAELDALYLYILRSILPQSQPIVMRIFELMLYEVTGVYLPYSLFEVDPQTNEQNNVRLAPSYTAKFLFVTTGQVYLHLVDLHSLLDVPSEADCSRIPIKFIHASFSEFLTDSDRSGGFFINQADAHLHLQLTRLKHVFIQCLSLNGGRLEGYVNNGMPLALVRGLTASCQLRDQELIRGLQALLDEDKLYFYQYLADMHIDEGSPLLKNHFVIFPELHGQVDIIMAFIKVFLTSHEYESWKSQLSYLEDSGCSSAVRREANGDFSEVHEDSGQSVEVPEPSLVDMSQTRQNTEGLSLKQQISRFKYRLLFTFSRIKRQLKGQ